MVFFGQSVLSRSLNTYIHTKTPGYFTLIGNKTPDAARDISDISPRIENGRPWYRAVGCGSTARHARRNRCEFLLPFPITFQLNPQLSFH